MYDSRWPKDDENVSEVLRGGTCFQTLLFTYFNANDEEKNAPISLRQELRIEETWLFTTDS